MTGQALSLADLERHDPDAPGRDRRERRFCCPLPACAGKSLSASHRCLTVNTETGAWKCHRCGASGKLREWWQEGPRLSRRERGRRHLARIAALPAPIAPAPGSTCPGDAPGSVQAGVPAAAAAEEGPARDRAHEKMADPNEWRAQLRGLQPLAGTPGAAYLQNRGIGPGLAHRAGVRYHGAFYGRPAVVFPIRDRDGRLVAAQGRYTDGRADPKTRTGGRLSAGVFATAGAWEAAAVVLTEAPIDALSLAAAGVPTLALCGTGGEAARKWLAPELAFRRVLLAFDADPAGDQAAEEWSRALLRFGATVARLRPTGAKDWNEMLAAAGPDELRCAAETVLRAFPAPIAPDDGISPADEPDAQRSDPDAIDAPSERFSTLSPSPCESLSSLLLTGCQEYERILDIAPEKEYIDTIA